MKLTPLLLLLLIPSCSAGVGGSGAPGVPPDAIPLEAADNVFLPDRVDVHAGETVTVAMRNTGVAPHTFTVESLGLDVKADAGKTVPITFTVSEAGSVKIVCTLHETLGMVAELVARPS